MAGKADPGKLLIRSVPPRLKGKIARRASDEKRSMNDVLLAVLHEHYGLDPYLSSDGRSKGVGASPNILLYNVSAELRAAIDLAAGSGSARNEVVRVLSVKFGTPFKPVGRWANRRPAAA